MDKRNILFKPLLFLNIAAVLVGFFYYSEQLKHVSAQFLLFVPDCPLYVLLAIPILIGIVKNDAYSFLVSVGMAKYGLWTVFVLLFHWGYYSTPFFFWTTIIFILGHIGMALEGLALLPERRVGASALALIILVFLLNDYSDYWLGTAPSIPQEGILLVGSLTIAASIALPLLLFAFGKKIRGLPAVRQLRGIIFA